MVTGFPWVSVCGYGAHIKSSQQILTIQKNRIVEEYPLESVGHLLMVGGHTINSSTINTLLKKGIFISFFESDGTPVGTIRPFEEEVHPGLIALQQEIPRQRFATALAQGSIKSRLNTIRLAEDKQASGLLYEGELELLHNSLDEIGYLIKLDEIRRLHRLTADMYYEIMARNLPADFGFRRRTLRPQTDPVNAMLSLGYAMLYGSCCVSIIGAHLNPDYGFLHDGKGGLVRDLIEPLKAGMIDSVVFSFVKESLSPAHFECTNDRCLLSDDLAKELMRSFYTSINTKKINDQVLGTLHAIRDNDEFIVLY